MALNPQYDAIGKGFVQQYYILFDDPAQRANLANMYNVETSFMTFEGVQLQGAVKIMEKLNSLTFQKIGRLITSVDSQPMFDGGVLINVLGRLQCDDDPPHPYIQTFVLKPLGDSFFVQHDIFRLGIHDVA
ncbi:probable nuclear transport factor 2 isoform X1 [Maniola jurtina]|uniref:probable nuclear transport factor 2 isoform X1 n=1 Tax=Aphantopus hyperantus TaxID=2795564 RepID=UPI0015696D1A|nr:probable nuclear transport factor 2 isoform X1 [Maniola hyperantus]XP_045785106.1 probable nuclear transport factor 2 isoform X1 [Maniola jurtina]